MNVFLTQQSWTYYWNFLLKKKNQQRDLNERVLRPEVGEMMIAEPKRKEKDSSSFLAKTQSMKTLVSFLTVALTASFPSMKLLPFPCCVGTHMWLTMIVVRIVILSWSTHTHTHTHTNLSCRIVWQSNCFQSTFRWPIQRPWLLRW